MRDWQAKGAQHFDEPDRQQGAPRSSAGCRTPSWRRSRASATARASRTWSARSRSMLDAYREGKIDRLLLVHTTFVNTMTQKPRGAAAAARRADRGAGLQEHWDYIYEPEAADILDAVLCATSRRRFIAALVENVASEMAARMVAMKAATDNAGKLIDELQLVYNKARQAAITKELAEIVGGAAAV